MTSEQQQRFERLESWATLVCEYLRFRVSQGPEVNGAGLMLDIYNKLPPAVEEQTGAVPHEH